MKAENRNKKINPWHTHFLWWLLNCKRRRWQLFLNAKDATLYQVLMVTSFRTFVIFSTHYRMLIGIANICNHFHNIPVVWVSLYSFIWYARIRELLMYIYHAIKRELNYIECWLSFLPTLYCVDANKKEWKMHCYMDLFHLNFSVFKVLYKRDGVIAQMTSSD